MGKTPREQMLLMLMPAFAVVAVYMLGYNRDAELTKAREELEAFRPSAVSDYDVDLEREKLQETEVKMSAVKKEKSELEKRWAALDRGQQSDLSHRSGALLKLTQMLWDRGLHTVEESAASEGGSEIPPSFQDALTKLKGDQAAASSSQGAPQRLWKIRFYGRYADVLEALETLRDSGSPVIPVGLSMSETQPETDWRSWTLLIWI
jgi:hypothetical protein